MQAGDLIRVARQPAGTLIHLEGDVGFIELVVEDRAQIMILKENGSVMGSGSLPLNCLDLCSTADITKRKALHDTRVQHSLEQMKARIDLQAQAEKRTAELVGLPVEKVREVLSTYDLEKPEKP